MFQNPFTTKTLTHISRYKHNAFLSWIPVSTSSFYACEQWFQMQKQGKSSVKTEGWNTCLKLRKLPFIPFYFLDFRKVMWKKYIVYHHMSFLHVTNLCPLNLLQIDFVSVFFYSFLLGLGVFLAGPEEWKILSLIF